MATGRSKSQERNSGGYHSPEASATARQSRRSMVYVSLTLKRTIAQSIFRPMAKGIPNPEDFVNGTLMLNRNYQLLNLIDSISLLVRRRLRSSNESNATGWKKFGRIKSLL